MQINNIQNGQSNAVYGVRSAVEVSEKEQEKVKEASEELHGRDEYIPSEKDEPIGIYAVSQDDEEKPKINFESPEKSDKEADDMPEKSAGYTSCTTNTDNVDREIKQLKEQVQQLSQRINSAEGKDREHLEKQLKRVQSELSQKDNDNYRRQHAVIS
ncbi:MAG: hypothetical protein J1F28_10675 [Oscillospiraceae bacterium]|nr:hypothetical protein [Oscillospiraceae bacterium]